MTVAVQIDELSFAHASVGLPALERVSISIKEGESVALLGPSGAGKTTLLGLLDGQLRGWRGHVSVCGLPLSPIDAPPRERRLDTGFVFQEFALVERATVLRNVMNGRLGRMSPLRALFGQPSGTDLAVVQAALADCGIADLSGRRVDSLSGGQRQRVAIARCLAQEPRIILADEPVSNLDPKRAAEILTLLSSVGRTRGATTIFSSHQPELARRFAERVIGIRNGRVVFDMSASAVTGDATAELYRDADPVSGRQLQVVH